MPLGPETWVLVYNIDTYESPVWYQTHLQILSINFANLNHDKFSL